MASDSIASLSDSALLAMATNLHDTIFTTPANYGQAPAYVTNLNNAVEAFSTALGEHVSAQATAKMKTVTKNDTRSTLESLIRDARVSAKAAKISEANTTQMGIPSGGSKVPTNATVPAVSVDTSERLRHKLDWTDADAPGNKKKPRGAIGAEIWVKIDGPPPGNEADCVFLTLDAFTPYVKEYSPTDAGKMAHYMLRWSMRDGSVSAWAETVSATITG